MTTNAQFLPEFTLNQLSLKVCMKLPNFMKNMNRAKMWERIPETCIRIEDEPRTLDTVIAEYLQYDTKLNSDPTINRSHLNLTLLYILLYYRHRDDQIYKGYVFPELKRYMGVYADDKILKDVIHAKIDEILINDEFMKETKKKDVKPVFKFESLPGDVRDNLFIEYNEEKLFREMSNEVQELCQTYNTHLDVAEVWYNAKKVVHTLRDINRPELLIQRAAVALAPGQMYNGFEGSQIILLCVYMMICESPNHEYFSNFITKMEYEESSNLSDMQVIARKLNYMKIRYNEKSPYDDYDYIGETALKQESFTQDDMERVSAEYEKMIQSLVEEKNAKEEENKNLHKTIQELETQLKSFQEEEDEELSEPSLGILHNKVKFEFFLRLLEQSGVNVLQANKTDIGDLWHAFTEKSADNCRKYCSLRDYKNNHTKQDIKDLNKRLSDLGITSIQL